ncbi:hypothetical protein ACFLYL_00395 [Chloroflexota bacterium]
MNNSKNNKENPPSLDLSFEWLKNTLEDQVQDMRYLYGKSVTLFSVASAIISFAIPLALTQLRITTNCWFFVSTGLYALLTIIVISSFIQQKITTLRNPITIREWYWDMKTSEFKMEILTHMEDAFTENERRIVIKSYVILAMTSIMALEIIFIILFILQGLINLGNTTIA